MKKKNLNIIKLFCFLHLWLFPAIFIQAQYLPNGSLEGPLGSQPPYFWSTCDSWSDPDIMDAFIPYLGHGEYIYPVDGNTLCLLRTRGTNYNADFHKKETAEYLYTGLNAPLEVNACYRFTAYLCFNSDIQIYDSAEPDIAYPLKLRLYGGLDTCGVGELLYESGPISNTAWQKYTFDFTVFRQTYNYFKIQPYWDSAVKNGYYNGIMLFDKLTLDKLGNTSLPVIHDLNFSIDPPLQLTAQNGSSYNWEPKTGLNAYDIQSPLVLEYNEKYYALIDQGSICPSIDIFNIRFDCDILYPGNVFKVYDIYYKYDEEIMLNASPGVSYNWDPPSGLSAFNISNPLLTGYNNEYTVSIIDRYGCAFEEQFNILIKCDTLYPVKNIMLMDTAVDFGTSVQLHTLKGNLKGNWIPTDGLSCLNCNTPVATPKRPTLYEAGLTDQFNCEHTEQFFIDINLVIPNVFTPNNDGVNDVFEILGLTEGSSVMIFDKSGSLVFSADPYNETCWWDGKDINGKKVETGAYWYALDISFKEIVKKGFVLVKY